MGWVWLAGAGLLAIPVLLAWRRPGTTAPITGPDGRPLPGSVASLERIRLGGVLQSVLLRGRDVRNPVLLFLHGGPGTSELGMLRAHNLPALEGHFTVAVWDQRGAGRSWAAREPAEGLTVEQLISDTRELAELLGRRFGQERIYLAGHSWGSALGALTVRRHPERFLAFVGIGQVVNVAEGERLSWEWTLARARAAGERRAVATLERIGPPPYPLPIRPSLVAQRRLLARYGGEVHGNQRGGMGTLLRGLLGASEYAWGERLDVFRGVFLAMEVLWPQIRSIDLFSQAPALAVPVYFLEGRHDMEAPSSLVERYHQVLVAPSKALVWFERSAHFVNTEEAEAFNRFFVERLLPETLPAAGAIP